MKTKHWTGLLSDLVPKREFDQNAQTIQEFADASKMCRSSAVNYIRKLVNAGKAEQCWKKIDGKPIRAYRPV